MKEMPLPKSPDTKADYQRKRTPTANMGLTPAYLQKGAGISGKVPAYYCKFDLTSVSASLDLDDWLEKHVVRHEDCA
jgi:hypothetical protein